MKIIPLQAARDPKVEPHDRSPRWLGEDRAFPTGPVTPDSEDGAKRGGKICEKCKAKGRPKCLCFLFALSVPCHGVPDQRSLMDVQAKRPCKACLKALRESAAQFEHHASEGGNLDRLATAWLKKEGKNKVSRRGLLVNYRKGEE